MKFAVVDIETTGSRATHDKIIELAVLIHDGERVLDTFQTLLNPDCKIPPYIAGFTGISENMVAAAPRFYEVARKFVEMTDDCIFVAHNAQFDYHFIRAEYRALGFEYVRPRLCTVRASRKILPGFPSYSLGKLCRSLEIPLEHHHRAFDDAQATTFLLKRMIESSGLDAVLEMVQNEAEKGTMPPYFSSRHLKGLPPISGWVQLFDPENRLIAQEAFRSLRAQVRSWVAGKLRKQLLRNQWESIHHAEIMITGSNVLARAALARDRASKEAPAWHLIPLREDAGTLAARIWYGNGNAASITQAPTQEALMAKVGKLIPEPLCSCNSDKAQTCLRHVAGTCCAWHDPAEYEANLRKWLRMPEVPIQHGYAIERGRFAHELTVFRIRQGRLDGCCRVEAPVRMDTIAWKFAEGSTVEIDEVTEQILFSNWGKYGMRVMPVEP